MLWIFIRVLPNSCKHLTICAKHIIQIDRLIVPERFQIAPRYSLNRLSASFASRFIWLAPNPIRAELETPHQITPRLCTSLRPVCSLIRRERLEGTKNLPSHINGIRRESKRNRRENNLKTNCWISIRRADCLFYQLPNPCATRGHSARNETHLRHGRGDLKTESKIGR